MVEMEDNTPLVSVVLPFYKAPFLSRAVESILNQTYSNFELILVDNASEKPISQVAHNYSLKDGRIKIIPEPNRGVVHAVNAGINNSNGKYIMRMDADDYSFPNRIQSQVEFLEDHNEIGVVSGLVEYEGDSKNIGFIEYINWLNTVLTPEQISLNQFVEFPLANPSMMMRKELFDQFETYSKGDFPEDYEWFLRLMMNGIKMAKVAVPVLKWVDSENRLTRTDPRYDANLFYEVKARYLAQWLKTNNPYHPSIVVWGAGRVSRRRSDLLKKWGIKINSYIDIKRSNDIIFYEDIPSPGECFIVSYVGNRGVRGQIRKFLIDKGYKEGINFIIAA